MPHKLLKFTGGYLENQSNVEENHLFRGRYAKISTDDRGLYFFTEGRRPEVKKYNPRSEVDHLSISTDKEVVLLYNFDFIPPLFFFDILFSRVRMIFLDMKGTRPEVKKNIYPGVRDGSS